MFLVPLTMLLLVLLGPLLFVFVLCQVSDIGWLRILNECVGVAGVL